MSTAWWPGFAEMVPAGRFQMLLGLGAVLGIGHDHVGRQAVDELVPTSRAVPHALGWPVRLSGLAPGRQILPVSRCRSVIRLFIHVPRTCWLTPMHHRLTVPRGKSP